MRDLTVRSIIFMILRERGGGFCCASSLPDTLTDAIINFSQL